MKAISKSGLKRLQYPLVGIGLPGLILADELPEKAVDQLYKYRRILPDSIPLVQEKLLSAKTQIRLIAGQHRAEALKRLCQGRKVLGDLGAEKYKLSLEDAWWYVDFYDESQSLHFLACINLIS